MITGTATRSVRTRTTSSWSCFFSESQFTGRSCGAPSNERTVSEIKQKTAVGPRVLRGPSKAMPLSGSEQKAPEEQYAEDYHNCDDYDLHQSHCATSSRQS